MMKLFAENSHFSNKIAVMLWITRFTEQMKIDYDHDKMKTTFATLDDIKGWKSLDEFVNLDEIEKLYLADKTNTEGTSIIRTNESGAPKRMRDED